MDDQVTGNLSFDPSAAATITHSNLAAGIPWIGAYYKPPLGTTYYDEEYQPLPVTSGEQIVPAKLTQPSLDAIRALVRDEVRKAWQDVMKGELE